MTGSSTVVTPGDQLVVEERKVIWKHVCLAGFTCGQHGPCLLGMVGFYALVAGDCVLRFSQTIAFHCTATSHSLATFGIDGILVQKTGCHNGFSPIVSSAALHMAVFASWLSRMEVG